MPHRDLYPDIEPYKTERLPVSPLHTLYIEQCGNPDGVPVVFLHGGPGGGCTASHRRFFDPARYRIILFDQRGSGRSTPLGETRENTTPLLVADIEAIREHLGIERWHVFGGSWGSTLALAYAEAHPGACLSLVLRGIFLLRPSEIEWFLYGINTVFPEAWAKFAGHVPTGEQANLLAAYSRLLHDKNPDVRLAAARAWSLYEGASSSLLPNPEVMATMEEPVHAIGMAVMEAHYFTHNLFTPETDLVRHVDRIRHIQAVIVQGRYDMVCPIVSADELHRAWPEAEYIVIPDAGHSAMEPGIRSALIEATDRFAAIG
jgi:proline iminopeptidase